MSCGTEVPPSLVRHLLFKDVRNMLQCFQENLEVQSFVAQVLRQRSNRSHRALHGENLKLKSLGFLKCDTLFGFHHFCFLAFATEHRDLLLMHLASAHNLVMLNSAGTAGAPHHDPRMWGAELASQRAQKSIRQALQQGSHLRRLNIEKHKDF